MFDRSKMKNYSADATQHCPFTYGKGEKNAKETKTIFGEPIPVPFFGVELEVHGKRADDTPANLLEQVHRDCDDKVITKQDGSLDSQLGFEIVSAPATLRGHYTIWDGFFKRSARHCKGYNPDTSHTYGMHVHVTRAAFSPQHKYKFHQFYNDEHNREFITAMAGRNSNGYAMITGKKKIVEVLDHGEARAVAVNMTKGPTLEVRIFRSTTNRLGFFKNLELVVASFYFTKEASHNNVKWETFLDWLCDKRNQGKYNHLKVWLDIRGWLPVKLRLPEHFYKYSPIKKELTKSGDVKKQKTAESGDWVAVDDNHDKTKQVVIVKHNPILEVFKTARKSKIKQA